MQHPFSHVSHQSHTQTGHKTIDCATMGQSQSAAVSLSHPQVDRGLLNRLHTACLTANRQSSHLDTTCRKSVYQKPRDGLRHLALTPSRCSRGSSLAEQTIQFTHRTPLEGSEPPACEPSLSPTGMWTEAC